MSDAGMFFVGVLAGLAVAVVVAVLVWSAIQKRHELELAQARDESVRENMAFFDVMLGELIGNKVKCTEFPRSSWRGVVSKIWIEDGQLKTRIKDVELLKDDGTWVKSSREWPPSFYLNNSTFQIRSGEVIVSNQVMEMTITLRTT